MKILHLSSTSFSGGAALAANRLHKALLKEGHDSSFLALEGISEPDQKVETLLGGNLQKVSKLKKLTYSKVKNHIIKRFVSSDFEIFNLSNSHPLQNKINFSEYDLIHLHWVTGFLDPSKIFHTNLPVVWTLHDANPFTGGCHYPNGCSKYKEKKGCRNCHYFSFSPTNFTLSEQERKIRSFKKTNIICPSHWLTTEAKNSYVFKQNLVEHIYNIVPNKDFHPISESPLKKILGYDDDKLNVIIVAQSLKNPRKGILKLLEALHGVDIPLRIHAIGGSMLEPFPSKRIEIVNWGSIQNQKFLNLLYNSCELTLLPSIEDNLPNVMAESLLAGTPVMAFATGGMKDVLSKGDNGILIPPYHFKEFSTKLNSFGKTKGQFERKKIASWAAKEFSPNKIIEQHLLFYNKVINQAQ